MLLYHVLFALAVAPLLGIILWAGLRRPGPWADDEVGEIGLLMFFLLIFLAAWAGGTWICAIGPPLWGVYRVPFVEAVARDA